LNIAILLDSNGIDEAVVALIIGVRNSEGKVDQRIA